MAMSDAERLAQYVRSLPEFIMEQANQLSKVEVQEGDVLLSG
jgi:hypothetical protein